MANPFSPPQQSERKFGWKIFSSDYVLNADSSPNNHLTSLVILKSPDFHIFSG